MKNIHMRDLFQKDASRFDRFHVDLHGFLYDFSKNRITEESLNLLSNLARECGLDDRLKRMLAGEKINVTENRPVQHMALRGTKADSETTTFVKQQREAILRISEKIRADKGITDVVHMGTGGSDLGPRLVCRALACNQDGPRTHFVNNIDGDEILDILKTLKPENTVFIIASKAFSTAETLMNAATAKKWLLKSMSEQDAQEHFYAITQNTPAAEKTGIPSANILPMQDWIGGRFSLWSAIGVTIAIAFGFKTFEELLNGAAVMDQHFTSAPCEKNIPVIMAFLSVWYRNFWHFRVHAIVPYAQRLDHFPAYIQQLEMESNGKSADLDGKIIDYATAPAILGDVGTNAQHAFFQMFHQGSDVIPCDLIIIKDPGHDLQDHHRMLVCNALAQGEALMQGLNNPKEPHRHFEGNRPSSAFLLERLDAFHLGMLIAAYEHKAFVQGALWNINSFDQWGVELGKTLARELIEACETDRIPSGLDSSTAALLSRITAKKS